MRGMRFTTVQSFMQKLTPPPIFSPEKDKIIALNYHVLISETHTLR